MVIFLLTLQFLSVKFSNDVIICWGNGEISTTEQGTVSPKSFYFATAFTETPQHTLGCSSCNCLPVYGWCSTTAIVIGAIGRNNQVFTQQGVFYHSIGY